MKRQPTRKGASLTGSSTRGYHDPQRLPNRARHFDWAVGIDATAAQPPPAGRPQSDRNFRKTVREGLYEDVQKRCRLLILMRLCASAQNEDLVIGPVRPPQSSVATSAELLHESVSLLRWSSSGTTYDRVGWEMSQSRYTQPHTQGIPLFPTSTRSCCGRRNLSESIRSRVLHEQPPGISDVLLAARLPPFHL